MIKKLVGIIIIIMIMFTNLKMESYVEIEKKVIYLPKEFKAENFKIYNKEKLQQIEKNLQKLKREHEIKTTGLLFKVTFYDLSVQSCGKVKNHIEYGLTAFGINLRYKNWDTARVISVDPKIIKLGTKVDLLFNDKNLQKYNGRYIAGDTGSAIKDYHIDFYIGENCTNLCEYLGVKYAYLKY